MEGVHSGPPNAVRHHGEEKEEEEEEVVLHEDKMIRCITGFRRNFALTVDGFHMFWEALKFPSA
jgi:hypothetical protein